MSQPLIRRTSLMVACALLALVTTANDCQAAEPSSKVLAETLRRLSDVKCALDDLEICGPAPRSESFGGTVYSQAISGLTAQQRKATRARRDQLAAGNFEGAARTVQAIRVLGLARSVLGSRPGDDGSWDDICAHMACISALHSYVDVLARQAVAIEVLGKEVAFGASVEVKGAENESLALINATNFYCFPSRGKENPPVSDNGSQNKPPSESPRNLRKPPPPR